MSIIKFLFHYCFTKKITIIFIILSIILMLLFFFSISGINESLSYTEIIENYNYSAIYYTKVIIVLMSCYLFMNIMNNKSLFTINFIVSSGNKKSKYLYNYIIINTILLLIFLFITFLLYFIIGIFNKKYFVLSADVLISFIYIFFLSVYYGLLALLFTIVLKNAIGFIFSFLVFILSELINSSGNVLEEGLKVIIPNFNDYRLIKPIMFLSTFIFIIFIMEMIKTLFMKMDLNY